MRVGGVRGETNGEQRVSGADVCPPLSGCYARRVTPPLTLPAFFGARSCTDFFVVVFGMSSPSRDTLDAPTIEVKPFAATVELAAQLLSN